MVELDCHLPIPCRCHISNIQWNRCLSLSARSYQPGLNSYKELATSTLLKRQDDSEGSSEVDSGSGSSPSPDTTPNDSEESSEVDSGSGSSPSPDTTPNDSEESSEVDSGSGSSPSPDTTPNDSEESSEVDSGSDSSPSPDTTPEKKFSPPFTEETVNSMALASTIDNVGDGIAGFYEDGDKAGQMLRGDAGDLLTKYLRRASYVNAALRNWVDNFVPGILLTVKSGLSEKRYSKALSNFTSTSKQLTVEFRGGLTALLGATLNIVNNVGLVAENLQTINKSFDIAFSNRMALFWLLRALLNVSKASETLEGYLANIIKSVERFYANQNKLHAEIMEKLETAPSQ
ncbi:hypothetical protein BASA60_011404 [Batrachochytrium salamandrivorans]|nr:hypothetical protein BASA60_011404 [Batrachochytrium salamandrivorans]